MTIDLLPTIARLTGAPVSPGLTIDGEDIGPLLLGRPAGRSRRARSVSLYFYWGRELQAVRSGRWKMHLPHGKSYRTFGGRPAGAAANPVVMKSGESGWPCSTSRCDPGEADRPRVPIPRRRQAAGAIGRPGARDDLGDQATGRKGRGVRPPGRLGESSSP